MKNASEEIKVWVYQADRELNNAELELLTNKLFQFTQNWTAHQVPLRADFEIRYNRFIILMADERAVKPSGCSIDASVRFMKEIEKELSINLFNRLNLAYRRENDSIVSVDKEEFEKLMAAGEIKEDTTVFNNMVQNKQELDTCWEVPLFKSWHAQVFVV